MAIAFKDYFLFLRDHHTPYENHQRRSEGFPDESEYVRYVGNNRLAIHGMVSNVFQEGVNESFPRLPSLLAPGGEDVHQFEISLTATRPRVLMLWRKLTPAQRRRHNADHAIYFYIPSVRPFSAAHLAFFLLRFTYLAIRTYVTRHYKYDVHRQPQMRGLAYNLTPHYAYGIAFFSDLDDVYNDAAANAAAYPRYRTNPIAGLPISTWPPEDIGMTDEERVLRCYHDATALARA